MANEITVRWDAKRVTRNLRNMLKPEVRRGIMREVGLRVLFNVRRRFRRMSTERKWKPLAAVTVILRRGGGRMYDESDIERKRARLKQLWATGKLYRSLFEGSPGNVLTVTEKSVLIGTSVPYAKVHQKGGKSGPFAFNIRSFSQLVPRKRGAAWNKFHFQQKNRLRKMVGKQYNVPRRQIIVKPTQNELDEYKQLAVEVLATTGRGGR